MGLKSATSDALKVTPQIGRPNIQIMFDNDANVLYSHKNVKTLFQIVNSELKLVNRW